MLITIEVTEEQRAVISEIHNPMIQVSQSIPGVVVVTELIDSSAVVIYYIYEDGSSFTEELNGMGNGWQRYGFNGEPIEWDQELPTPTNTNTDTN